MAELTTIDVEDIVDNNKTGAEKTESEDKVVKTPTPQLNQACMTRRELEEKVDLRETTQGERYLTAMVINPTIKYALTPMFGPKGGKTVIQAAKNTKEAKKAVMRYMHDRYEAIPYQNYQQKMAVLEYDFNRVFRYLSSEYEVHFEGSVDFKVTVEDSVNLEHTYLCHLVKDNLKWLLGIEINEFMECEDESYFVNSLQVELDNLHETQKNSQKIYKKLPCEKSACSISYALKYLYQHQMDILN